MNSIKFIGALTCALTLSAHAAVWDFTLSMDAAPGVPSPGTGGSLALITYDTDSQQLHLDIGWGSDNGFVDLLGTASDPIIKGPSNQSLYGLGAPAAGTTSGSGTAIATLGLHDNPNGPYSLTQQETDLHSGLWSIEVPTNPNYGSGEIRGQLTPVPEPEQYAMVAGLALLGFAGYRRYKMALCV